MEGNGDGQGPKFIAQGDPETVARLQQLFDQSPTNHEMVAEPRPDLVAKYKLFGQKANPTHQVIYHPCGANDTSPSAAFPGSRVIYADIDEHAMGAVKKAGYEAHTVDVNSFDPGEVDILFLLNPAIISAKPASFVKEGGYVLSNDYHGNATELHDNPDFALKAMIRVLPDGTIIYDTDKLEDYWHVIDSEEEFKNAEFDWGAVHYSMAVEVVEDLTGSRENVLENYKKILADAREQDQFDNDDDLLILNHGDRQYVLPTQLPRKKGNVDDLFVFEKTKKEPQVTAAHLDQANLD